MQFGLKSFFEEQNIVSEKSKIHSYKNSVWF